MVFPVTCPNDGDVDVCIEDVDGVVLKGRSRAEITVICPRCGRMITVTATIPAFLFSAIEALAAGSDANGWNGVLVVSSERKLQDSMLQDSTLQDPTCGSSCSQDPYPCHKSVEAVSPAARAAINNAYCEYFRRQLASVVSAEDILAQIDTGTA